MSDERKFDSRKVAKYLDKEHHAVTQAIGRNKSRIESKGSLNKKTDYTSVKVIGGRPSIFYELNKEQLLVVLNSMAKFDLRDDLFDILIGGNTQVIEISEDQEISIEDIKGEKHIELRFIEYLRSNNVNVKSQVRCKVGVADVVTNNSIFEIKRRLNFGSVRDGVAQILSYRDFINKKAKLYIVGEEFKKYEELCSSYTKKFDITLIRYNFENDRFSKIGG